MANQDLSGYNLSELKGLQYEVEKAIKDRQHGEVRQARERILAIAKDAGVSVSELLAASGKKPKKEAVEKAQGQYQHPEDASKTWTGRGRKPKWITEGLASGKKLGDFRKQ